MMGSRVRVTQAAPLSASMMLFAEFAWLSPLEHEGGRVPFLLISPVRFFGLCADRNGRFLHQLHVKRQSLGRVDRLCARRGALFDGRSGMGFQARQQFRSRNAGSGTQGEPDNHGPFAGLHEVPVRTARMGGGVRARSSRPQAEARSRDREAMRARWAARSDSAYLARR